MFVSFLGHILAGTFFGRPLNLILVGAGQPAHADSLRWDGSVAASHSPS